MGTAAQQAIAIPDVAIVHPLELGGIARRWWLLARLAGLTSTLAMVGVVGWIAAGAPVQMSSWVAGAFVAAAMAAFWGIGRLRWLAWAHVPGASRRFASEAEERRALPRHRADRALLILDDVLLAAGGLAIVSVVGTEFARILVGVLGAMLLGYAVASIAVAAAGRRFQRRGDLAIVAVHVVGPLVWCWTGWTSAVPAMAAAVLSLVLAFGVTRLLAAKGAPRLDRFFERLDGPGRHPKRHDSSPG